MKINVKNTIYNKLLIICLALLILPGLVIGFESYKTAKDELDEDGKVLLKNSVNQVVHLIDAKQEEVTRGNLTIKQAQEEIKEIILGKKNSDGTRPINKAIDLGQYGYISILDSEGDVHGHPSLEGKNIMDLEDEKTGFRFVEDLIKQGKSGGGYTEYIWKLPGTNKFEEKISYSAYDEDWDWIVSAGTYKLDFNEGSRKILYVLGITLGIACIIGILVILLFARHISSPIRKINRALEQVANGDLSIDTILVKNNDEIGTLAKSYNIMIENLKGLLSTVKNSSNTVTKASSSLQDISSQTAKATDEVAQTISEIANSSSEQARDVEEGATQINQLGKEIEDVAIISDEMDKLSNQTNNLTREGLEVVNILANKSEENSIAAQKVNDMVLQLNDNTKQIGIITETISKIADQTNLLALNASIEAARAGDAGRGFAVVAGEIRKLAEQSAKAINDINNILQDIQNSSEVAVNSTRETKNIANQQNEAVENTKKIFSDISSVIQKLIGKVDAVTGHSISMNKKKEKIISMIENLSAISEETAASTEEVSAATQEQSASIQEVASYAQELNTLSNDLLNAVNGFKID